MQHEQIDNKGVIIIYSRYNSFWFNGCKTVLIHYDLENELEKKKLEYIPPLPIRIKAFPAPSLNVLKILPTKKKPS